MFVCVKVATLYRRRLQQKSNGFDCCTEKAIPRLKRERKRKRKKEKEEKETVKGSISKAITEPRKQQHVQRNEARKIK
jgi:hypothetical protein